MHGCCQDPVDSPGFGLTSKSGKWLLEISRRSRWPPQNRLATGNSSICTGVSIRGQRDAAKITMLFDLQRRLAIGSLMASEISVTTSPGFIRVRCVATVAAVRRSNTATSSMAEEPEHALALASAAGRMAALDRTWPR